MPSGIKDIKKRFKILVMEILTNNDFFFIRNHPATNIYMTNTIEVVITTNLKYAT